MLMPIKILDYVVAHELSHLVHQNHSKRFWLQVERIIPDYRERRKWLKKNGEDYTI
jgi:predicted metal-dependent hydrolase